MDYGQEVIYCRCGWSGLDSKHDIDFLSHVNVDRGGDHCICSQTEWELRREIRNLRERLSQTSALLNIYERAPTQTERRMHRRRHAQRDREI